VIFSSIRILSKWWN